jgi:hypothetical protein
MRGDAERGDRATIELAHLRSSVEPGSHISQFILVA